MHSCLVRTSKSAARIHPEHAARHPCYHLRARPPPGLPAYAGEDCPIFPLHRLRRHAASMATPVGYAEPLRCQTESTRLSRISDVVSLHHDILSLLGDKRSRRKSIA